jgi:transcriptional regulator with XRE-family HTH domain
MLKELLESEMKERRMSTREAAKSSGVSHTTIFRALRGDVVDVKTAIALAKWLNVKPSQLLNSLPPGEDHFPEKFTLMAEHYPDLKSAFEKIIQAIEKKDVDPSVLEDIAAYTLFRLDLARKGKK